MMNAPPLTRDVLDSTGCGSPGCTHDHTILYLRASCHSGKSVEVRYDKRDGALTITCPKCGRLVARVAVGWSL